MAEHHESSDALPTEKLHPRKGEQEEGGSGDEDDDEERKQRLGEFQPGELKSSVSELRQTQLKTLMEPSTQEFSEKDQFAGLQLESVSQSIDGAELQEQLGLSHQEILASVTNQDVQIQKQSQSQLTVYPTPFSELSPTSVTQSISSAPSPILIERRVPHGKTSASDGYNWRKYGQKQVKIPQGSRSYYRCTYSECYAKKIECCDHSGHVTDIVYKSQHTHDPPRKSICIKESKLALSAECVRYSVAPAEHSYRTVNDSEVSTSSKEPIQETPSVPERKRQSASDSDDNGDVKIKEENGDGDEPEPKRRQVYLMKKSKSEYSASLSKPGKKPKFVVHAAGDVGISGDGYRWRKYGQKMVKGNPHPRNYYRCTSAGCPVRKHIETAVDNTSAVIITYKGVHDHDMPVPKKRHGPPSAPLVAAAAPASMNSLHIKKTDTVPNQISSTQWSVDTGGELTGEALDLGGEKAMESARTLLSIGFEIKPC
ncbi:hypothetical protein ACFX10_017452 [Malus domestica]